MRKNKKEKTRRQIAIHNKNLSNAAMGKFLTMLRYKAEWSGVQINSIDQFSPSTKVCSKCGYVLEHSLTTDVRTWECPQCGEAHDRDFNAAVVIDYTGEKMLSA